MSFPLNRLADGTSHRLLRGLTLAALVQAGALLGLTAPKPAQAQPTPLFSTDFDGPSVAAPGVTFTPPISSTARLADAKDASRCADGWCGKHIVSGASQTFTLSGLPSHDYLSFNFLLGFLNSWDSTDGKHGLGWPEIVAPDLLGFYVDGNSVVEGLTFNNGSGTQRILGGGVLLDDAAQLDNDVYFTDALVQFADLIVPHSASTLNLEVRMYGTGIQGYDFSAQLPDEGWGLDNLLISYGLTATTSSFLRSSGLAPFSTSAPGPLPLLGTGAAFALSRRLRNRLQAARA